MEREKRPQQDKLVCSHDGYKSTKTKIFCLRLPEGDKLIPKLAKKHLKKMCF